MTMTPQETAAQLEIQIEGEELVYGEDRAHKSQVKVNFTDYGDDYFDCQYVVEACGECMLFGNASLCGIPGREHSLAVAQALADQAGGLEIKHSKELDWEW